MALRGFVRMIAYILHGNKQEEPGRVSGGLFTATSY
jgi:hypothetical protein